MTDKELIVFFEEFGETFPKLIRDQIPLLIIKNEGKPAITKKAVDQTELLQLVKRKVVEESMELYSYQTTEDIAFGITDIIEIIEKLKEVTGIDGDMINASRQAKNGKYGSFNNSIILVGKK